MSKTCVGHNCSYVSKVKVNHTGNVNKLGNTLNALTKNIVSSCKCIHHCNLIFSYKFKLFIRNNNEGVNVLLEVFNATESIFHSYLTFKCKRLCNDTNSKYTHITGKLCNYGSSTCTCSATHTCGDKQHICTCKLCSYVFKVFVAGILTHLGI